MRISDWSSDVCSSDLGSGIGGALYDRVREEAEELGAAGLYFECLPDDPDKSPDPKVRRQNAQRLKFYERYGAFPIHGIAYDLPIRPGDTDMRSEEHTSELQSLMRISYAVFCLTNKNSTTQPHNHSHTLT